MELGVGCEDSNAGGHDAAEAEVVMWHRIVIESLISWCQSLQKLQHCHTDARSVQQLHEGMRTKLRDEVNALILMSCLDVPSGQNVGCAAFRHDAPRGSDSPHAVCDQSHPNLLESSAFWKRAAMSEAGSAGHSKEDTASETAAGTSRASSSPEAPDYWAPIVEELRPEPQEAALQCLHSHATSSRSVVAQDVPVVADDSRSRSGSGRLRLTGNLRRRKAEAEKPSSQLLSCTSACRPRSSQRLQLRPCACAARARSLTRDEAIKVVAATLHKHLGPASRGPTMAA
eukprot:TRINITY_DN104921_c0_g1_i1.p1 TRINITY_DN104921_c0_g1~~TRINITY_DN104921_c0_g1_i1.p1  ORF type:complete len:301 (-),score=39.92 TRINITY_DN104921_c0_g1_i1:91-948(-)